MRRDEERPTPDPETVRETMRDRDDEEAEQGPDVDELPGDPAHDPDDEGLEGVKGG